MRQVLALILGLFLALPAFGARPLSEPVFQAFDSSGDPLSGGKVYAYEAGTTTPKDTYTDSTEGATNTWPVVLDSAGRAAIWVTGQCKIKVYDSDDVLVYEADNVEGDTSAYTLAIQSLASSYCADAGSTDAYACNLDPALGSYQDGMIVRFKANTVNTGAATLNLNGLGAKTIYKGYNTALGDGDIAAGQDVVVVYNTALGGFHLANYRTNASLIDSGTLAVARLPIKIFLATCSGSSSLTGAPAGWTIGNIVAGACTVTHNNGTIMYPLAIFNFTNTPQIIGISSNGANSFDLRAIAHDGTQSTSFVANVLVMY